MNGIDDVVICLWTRYCQNVRMTLSNQRRVLTEASGDDDSSILRDRLTDCVERFVSCAVEETTGIHDYHVCAVVIPDSRITFRLEPGEDSFRVDEGFGTTEADEADFWAGIHRAIIAFADEPSNRLRRSRSECVWLSVVVVLGTFVDDRNAVFSRVTPRDEHGVFVTHLLGVDDR